MEGGWMLDAKAICIAFMSVSHRRCVTHYLSQDNLHISRMKTANTQHYLSFACFLSLVARTATAFSIYSPSSLNYVEAEQRTEYPASNQLRPTIVIPQPPLTPPTWEQLNAAEERHRVSSGSSNKILSMLPMGGMTDFLGGDISSSLLGISATAEDAFAIPRRIYNTIQERDATTTSLELGTTNIEWIQGSLVAGICGTIAMAPVAFCNYYSGNLHSLAQWLFVVGMGSVQAAVFAMVYHYTLRREDDENPSQIIYNQVVGAFTLVRTLANLPVSDDPLSSFDWNLLNQVFVQGLESAVLFGAAGLALDVGFQNGWLSKLSSSSSSTEEQFLE
jgi:hypothetical protein